MKSKRAQEYIDEWYERTQQTNVDLIFCENAVKLAEQDAEDRAIKVRCDSCIDRNVCNYYYNERECESLENFIRLLRNNLTTED